MSLQSRLAAFITAVGADIKALQTGKANVSHSHATTDITSLLTTVYPVGSIYTSVTNTNPGTLFGGTWAAFGSGRIPIGVNGADPRFDAAEDTGGTDTLTDANLPSHTHALGGDTGSEGTHLHGPGTLSTGGQSANHTHNMSTLMKTNNPAGTGASDNGGDSVVQGTTSGRFNAGQSGATSGASVGHTHAVSSGATNAGTPHSHGLPATTGGKTGTAGQPFLPPYIAVYMWKRTA